MKHQALRMSETINLSGQSLAGPALSRRPRALTVSAFTFGVVLAFVELGAVLVMAALVAAIVRPAQRWYAPEIVAVVLVACATGLWSARRCDRDPAVVCHALAGRRESLGRGLVFIAPAVGTFCWLAGPGGSVDALRWAAVLLLANGFALWLVAVVGSHAAGLMRPARLALVGTADAQRNALIRFATCRPRQQILLRMDPTEEPGPAAQSQTRLDRLIAAIRAGVVDAVLLDPNGLRRSDLDWVLDRLAETPVEVRVVRRPGDEQLAPGPAIPGGPMAQQRIQVPKIIGWTAVLKRIEDLVLSITLLFACAPLMALIALAVRIDSPGPILFRQPRYGLNNRVFDVLKFRTIRNEQSDVAGALQILPGDDRATLVGRVLRRLSLDELPQLFNVFSGNMSVVGPRPHALHTRAADVLFEHAVTRYFARHNVKPGITGLAQVRGWRGPTTSIGQLEGRIEADLEYIRHWSLGLDVLIVIRTIPAMLRAKNAC